MKRSCLAMSLSASLLLMMGCSQSINTFASSQAKSASAQTLSPEESLQQARILAWDAALLVQQPPHSVEQWQEARVKWRQAVRLLEAMPANTPVTQVAQQKLLDYRAKYDAITQRLANEEMAIDHFEQAQAIAWQAAVTVQNPPHSLQMWQRALERWERAIRLMESIPPLTTVSAAAEAKAKTYRQNYQIIAQRLETEKAFLSTLEAFSTEVNQLNAQQTKALTGQTKDPIGVNYAEYQSFVASLKTLMQEWASSSTANQHPAYLEMQTAIADYEFALTIWQTYLRHKDANADWLLNGDFFNRLVPLSLIDSDRLLQRYDVKVHQGSKEAKVALKSTVWTIWEKAAEHARLAQQKAASFQ